MRVSNVGLKIALLGLFTAACAGMPRNQRIMFAAGSFAIT